jgi:PAS domain S-box-containing protein
VPLSNLVERNRAVELAFRVRRTPGAGYAVAIAAVAVAAAIRWLVGFEFIRSAPFIAFYPAIILAALVGGFRPGALATVLSAIIAWFLFIPAIPGFDPGISRLTALGLFLGTSAVNVGIVWLLNSGLDRIIDQERNVRVLIESAPNGVVLVDEAGTIKLVNASTERLFGYTRAELLGRSVEMLVPAASAQAHRRMREEYQQHPEARSMGAGRDLAGRRKDGSEFALEIGLSPVERNSTKAVLATIIDISERKQAEAQQQFLVRELHHRTQNLITVVQAIAQTSFRTGQSLDQVQGQFLERLSALSRAHRRLATAAWRGAPLNEILREELEGFSKRVTISGCDIAVNATMAQQFALIAHELATNAAKHGSLTSPAGQVAVEGSVERYNGEPIFQFTWREQGGPPVPAPLRKGFGSFILIDAMKGQDENVALNFESTGLRYELRLPLKAIAAEMPDLVPQSA